MNVGTNVGQEFLKLIDKHFPPGHILHSVINRQTVKVSYRPMPSMATYISRHNAKILKNEEKSKPPSCNCQKSKVGECPIPGACNTDGVVYQATVKNNKGKKENYIGLAQNFKKRYSKHKTNLTEKKEEGSITLYNHFWKEKGNQWLSGKFNPVTEICRLCTREKFTIVMCPEKSTLNSRQELFSHCKHKKSRLIGKPPG